MKTGLKWPNLNGFVVLRSGFLLLLDLRLDGSAIDLGGEVDDGSLLFHREHVDGLDGLFLLVDIAVESRICPIRVNASMDSFTFWPN